MVFACLPTIKNKRQMVRGVLTETSAKGERGNFFVNTFLDGYGKVELTLCCYFCRCIIKLCRNNDYLRLHLIGILCTGNLSMAHSLSLSCFLSSILNKNSKMEKKCELFIFQQNLKCYKIVNTELYIISIKHLQISHYKLFIIESFWLILKKYFYKIQTVILTQTAMC